MSDADQPRSQWPSIGPPPCTIEVSVGLQEGLLGQILGVVMVADSVIGIGIDVAQVGPVEILEGAVELGLLGRRQACRLDIFLCRAHPASLVRSCRPPGALDATQPGNPSLGVDLTTDQRSETIQRLGLDSGG